MRCKLKAEQLAAGIAKASPNWANEYRIVDPKPSDLPMAKGKLREIGVDA